MIARFVAKLQDKDIEQIFREWHSFEIGWSEGVSLFVRPIVPINENAQEEMSQEYHYFQVGRAVGFITILLIVGGLIKWLM